MNKKFIRVLGLGVGLFLAGSLSVNAQKVSFNGERLSLKQAFEKIESVSKYKIAYNTSQLDVNKQVVLNQKNQDVLQILSDLLKGTNCVYQVNNNYIVITLKDDEKVKKIKGTIKDSAGEPIIGANVILKGDATVGSITDIDGNFDLSVPSNATLQVSYIGYNTQDIPVGNKSFLNITLKEDTETLDEVVVVGYGSQKKVNVIGSIASVDSKALESRAVPDVSNMLTGQMSGVTITQESGNPGQDAGTIRIRGVGSFGATPSPLVLVDGLPGSLSDLTPADIDNISVLKDASSAAIYGSRAANGVILVTTKKGKEGKARIIYNGSVGMSQATELPELAHSYEYAEFYNKAIGAETYTPEMIQKYRDGSDPDNYADEMYLDDLLGGHALQTKHELSVSGGTEKVQYMVSLGYLRQNGLLDNNYYNRYNARVNLGAELAKNLKLQVVGEALMPSQYQAVATYSAKASYQAATGYVTTAEYIGDVTHEGVESVTYVLTYIGTEANHKGASAAQVGAFFADHFPWILGGIVLICAAVGGTLLVCRRKAVVKAECEADETEENEEDQEA